MPSERAFGTVFSAFFAFVAALQFHSSGKPGVWLAVAGAVLLVTLIAPGILRPANLAWFRFGILLHKVASPLILALMFFVVLTPFALLMRLFGKRPLHLGLDADSTTYWVARNPSAIAPESFKNQF